MQDKVDWLLSGNHKLPEIVAEQAMSNLLEVVSLHFVNAVKQIY